MPRAVILLAVIALLVVATALLRPSALSRKAETPPGARRLTLSYGEERDNRGELWLPAGAGPHPVVVLVHGGFWGSQYGADLMDGLAADLAGQGFAAWNIEYRRVGGGGGWPATFVDTAAAVDHLAALAVPYELDIERVATVGHSAGGHLAVWLASRRQIPEGSPGSGPALQPVLAVSQAGVLDLRAGAEAGLGGGAVQALMGGSPDDHPDRYAVASPAELAPAGVPVVMVHGEADRLVPIEQSRLYLRAAGESAADLEVLPGDHFEHLDAASPEWAAVMEALAVLKAPR